MSMQIPILQRRVERLEARIAELEKIVDGLLKLDMPILPSKEGDPPVFGIDHVGYGNFRILTPEGQEVPNVRVKGKATAEQVAREMSAQRALETNAPQP